jgi:hypothetical protein
MNAPFWDQTTITIAVLLLFAALVLLVFGGILQ